MSIKKIFALVVVASVIVGIGRWLHLQVAYAEIERLTELHESEIADTIETAVTAVQYPGSRYHEIVEYLKIFEYSQEHAKVFVVTQILPVNNEKGSLNDRVGVFYYLLYQNGTWNVDQTEPLEVIWSKLGSADGETWPPFY